jgi:hypothetical protein
VINVACRFIGFVLDFSVTVKNWERMNDFVTLANSFLGIYNCVVNIMKLSKYKIVSLFRATLIIPPAAQGAEQMSSVNVKATKEIANLRIHIERAGYPEVKNI